MRIQPEYLLNVLPECFDRPPFRAREEDAIEVFKNAAIPKRGAQDLRYKRKSWVILFQRQEPSFRQPTNCLDRNRDVPSSVPPSCFSAGLTHCLSDSFIAPGRISCLYPQKAEVEPALLLLPCAIGVDDILLTDEGFWLFRENLLPFLDFLCLLIRDLSSHRNRKLMLWRRDQALALRSREPDGLALVLLPVAR